MQNYQGNQPTYAVIGLGFVADKHIAAIKNIGGRVVAGCDIDGTKYHKVLGLPFFTNYEDMLEEIDCDYVVICTPNYLHYRMTMDSLCSGKKVILEKPAVLSMEELESLKPYSDRIFNIYQLRFNEELKERKSKLEDKKYEAEFAVCVHRDDWYFDSWKNKFSQSGGLRFNIGVHYFDLLCWFFGKPESFTLDESTEKRSSGTIKFKNCDAKWVLSIDQPHDNQFRYMKIDGETINLSQGFENLHTKIYQEALEGKNIPMVELEPVIELLTKYNENDKN